MSTKLITYAARVSAPREIAEALDIYVLRQEGSQYRPRRGDTIINWGCTAIPDVLRGHESAVRWINPLSAVSLAVDKIATLTRLSENNVPVVNFTTNLQQALQWARTSTVIQRNTVTGRQGSGILLCENGVLPNREGRLWTQYFPRRDEYRVHVCEGEVIDVQKKRLRTEVRNRISGLAENSPEARNVRCIRSYPNGWVFCRENVVCPEVVLSTSIRAVQILGLNFGAVDIGYARSRNIARIFEVNTAPGIEGTTIELYTRAFRRYLQAAS